MQNFEILKFKDKICRICICMTETTGLLNIYENCLEQKEMSIIEMLLSFTTIQVMENDGLPDNICLACISDINRAFSFKQKCERAEVTLKTYLQQLKSANSVKQESGITTLPDLGEITHLLKTEEILDIQQQPTQTEITKSAEIIIECLEENFEADEEKNKIVDCDNDNNEEIVERNNEEILEVKDEEIADTNVFYECILCCTRFLDKLSLKEHMIFHHETEYCSLCDIFFKTVELYAEHREKHRENNYETPSIVNEKVKFDKTNKVIHKCSYCGMDFVHKKNFEKHLIRYHSNDIKIKEDELNKQQLINIEEENTPLSELKNRTKTEMKIASIFKCSKCGARFVKEKSLRLHHNSNKCTEISYPCEICKRVFARKKNLTQHMLLHEDRKDYKCKECPKEFTRQDQLTLHMQNHRGIKKHQCGFCGKGFNMISTLKDHIRTHSGERPFLCSICGKGFSQSTNLKQHIMRHTKTKPFKCTICLYAFVSKGELDAHLRKHTGDHPFVCDVCGTGFTTSSSLVKHKRIHTGEKPYACEFCPMRFTALGTLKNHRRTHTGERPFCCKFCERTFAQKSDMVSHTRTHTGERPYICKLCNIAFQHSSTLKTHYKIHQNQDETGIIVGQ